VGGAPSVVPPPPPPPRQPALLRLLRLLRLLQTRTLVRRAGVSGRDSAAGTQSRTTARTTILRPDANRRPSSNRVLSTQILHRVYAIVSGACARRPRMDRSGCCSGPSLAHRRRSQRWWRRSGPSRTRRDRHDCPRSTSRARAGERTGAVCLHRQCRRPLPSPCGAGCRLPWRAWIPRRSLPHPSVWLVFGRRCPVVRAPPHARPRGRGPT
jgi:hypothetical protein